MKKFLMFALAAVISSNTCIAASYVIQPGDTLEGVAHKFGVSYDDLMKANSGINPEYVRNGLTYGFRIEIPERKVVQNQRAIHIVNPVPKHQPKVVQNQRAIHIVNPVPKPQPKHQPQPYAKHTTPGPAITIVEEDTTY